MSVTSPSSLGIFRTLFGISSMPEDVSLRDIRSAARFDCNFAVAIVESEDGDIAAVDYCG